jgi:hypothetical protein
MTEWLPGYGPTYPLTIGLYWFVLRNPLAMAQAQADALAVWFRRTAAARTVVGGKQVGALSAGKRTRMLYSDAADSADRLPPDDERLGRLTNARRFSDFYGELLFVGGGPAIHKAKLDSVERVDATGQRVLEAVIVAALSESAPGDIS